jgi:hypothetical protein
MRPVRRRGSPRQNDFADYRDALPELVSRLGPYCSYCERRVATQLAVEHIEPKALHPARRGRWENFLLACVNCNSTKGDSDVVLADTLLPDRDNTFVAVRYAPDGTVAPAPGATQPRASATLALVGLDKPIAAAEACQRLEHQHFDADQDMRRRLVDAFEACQRLEHRHFSGTRESGCFDATERPVRPAPNPDGLPHGGKA